MAALGNGLCLAVLVYSTAGISGGHLNPAVSIGFIATGRLFLLAAAAAACVRLPHTFLTVGGTDVWSLATLALQAGNTAIHPVRHSASARGLCRCCDAARLSAARVPRHSFHHGRIPLRWHTHAAQWVVFRHTRNVVLAAWGPRKSTYPRMRSTESYSESPHAYGFMPSASVVAQSCQE